MSASVPSGVPSGVSSGVPSGVSGDTEWSSLYGVKKSNLNATDMWYACFCIAFEVIRIVASSLLVVFIPQNCDGHVCSFKENFVELTNVNKTALGVNFITLIALLIMYVVIYKREKFLIYRMEEDGRVPKDNCLSVLSNDLEIAAGVRWYNRAMLITAIISALIYLLNLVLSAVVIFGFYYNGYASITQFFINSCLCMYLIYRAITHSRSKLVLSNTTFVPTVYNTIDPEYDRRKRSQSAVIETIAIEQGPYRPSNARIGSGDTDTVSGVYPISKSRIGERDDTGCGCGGDIDDF